MTLSDAETARVRDAAERISIHQGDATVEAVAIATGFDADAVREALTRLVARGNLIALPGGAFGLTVLRRLRRPGVGIMGVIDAPMAAAMMGAR